MKKISLFLMGLILCMGMMFTSCESCNRETNEPVVTEELTYAVAGLDVNYINVSDIDWMGMQYADKDWKWLECCIDMEDFIDEADTCNVIAVANIFEYIDIVDTVTGAWRPVVILRAHVADTTVTEMREGLWVGDDPMNEYNPMEVDFAHAWNYMMMANCVKPHSQHCVLRKEVGPIAGVDPIYIFGNETAQVYVMSNTGEVTTTNPVFPQDANLEATAEETNECEYEGTIYGPKNTRIGCPLGEWP